MSAESPTTRSHGPTATMALRALGVARLDGRIVREVRDDRTATTQALIVVLLVAAAGALGSAAGAGLGEFLGQLATGVVVSLVFWVVFAAIALFVGTDLIRGARSEVTIKELLRTLGFADAPGLLTSLGFIPVLGIVVALIGFVWVLVAQVVALRATFETTTERAIAIAVISGFASVLVAIIPLAALVSLGVVDI